MRSSTSGSDGSESGDSPDHLRARFQIELHPEANCSVLERGYDGGPVYQSLVDTDADTNCRCLAEVDGDNGQQHLIDTLVSSRCVCPVLASHECITSLEAVEDGYLVVSIVTSDRDELVAIVSSLREIGASPRLIQITGPNVDVSSKSVAFEVDGITEKQREAVQMAVEAGYYDTPREATLGDLAHDLGVSRSAVSQRLSAVESTLIGKLFEADGGSRSED